MGLGLLWAVLAAMVSHMVVGMAWYGWLFARPWMAAMGMQNLTEQEKQQMSRKAMPGYLTGMAGAALATVVIWFLHEWTQGAPEAYSSVMKGVVLGTMGWLAFWLGPTLTARFFESQKTVVWAIGGGYWLVMAVLYGVWVGVFA